MKIKGHWIMMGERKGSWGPAGRSEKKEDVINTYKGKEESKKRFHIQ